MTGRTWGRVALAGALVLVAAAIAGPAAAQDGGRIVLEKAGDGMGWLATWRLAEPARSLRFERPASGFRARTFEVLTPGFRFERDGDFEVLLTDGEPVYEIRVRFPEFDEQLTREYEFFRRFTDGGVAVYTGHLVATPGDGAGGTDAAGASAAADPPRPPIRSFRFVPPGGAAVVVAGVRSEERLEWNDPVGRGTYAYIGAAAPVATEDVISIIDPGLPGWLEARARDALPRLFALYRERLDAEPSERPMVLFDYEAGEPTGHSYGGGTLPGLIQLGVRGRDWEAESAGAMVSLMHFLAHEAAHVWNGEIAHYPGSEDAWMHEGSADAFADRALLELGVLDEAGFLDRQSAALNECRADLEATPLRPSAQRGRPQMAYKCGNVIALLSEAALVARGADLFELWRELIGRALRQGGEYHAGDYVEVWRSLGATDADLAELQAFLDGAMTPARLAAALAARAVRVEETEPPPAYGRGLARTALAGLMGADCGGRVSFTATAEGLVLGDRVECGVLLPGGRVVALGGHDVLQAGHLAYDAVRTGCVTGGRASVSLVPHGGGDVTKLEVGCADRPLPVRPPYVRILERSAG